MATSSPSEPDDLRPGKYAISVSLTADHTVGSSHGHSTIGQQLDGAANPGASNTAIP